MVALVLGAFGAQRAEGGGVVAALGGEVAAEAEHVRPRGQPEVFESGEFTEAKAGADEAAGVLADGQLGELIGRDNAMVEGAGALGGLGGVLGHVGGDPGIGQGVEWMILTNGQVWQVWHLTPGLPVVLDLALDVDLLGEGGPTQKADILFHLSKEAFKHHVIDDLWRVKAATSARSIATVITSDSVIDQIRKELRRQTGHNMDPAELSDLIRSDVLRSDTL